MDSLAELSWQSSAELLQLAASLGVQLSSRGQPEMELQMQQTLLGLMKAAAGGVLQEGAAPSADAAEPAHAATQPLQQAAGGVPAGAAAGAGPVPLEEGAGSKSRSRSGDHQP
jgi:hypothetical protein